MSPQTFQYMDQVTTTVGSFSRPQNVNSTGTLGTKVQYVLVVWDIGTKLNLGFVVMVELVDQ